jgi:hypothetical protein
MASSEQGSGVGTELSIFRPSVHVYIACLHMVQLTPPRSSSDCQSTHDAVDVGSGIQNMTHNEHARNQIRIEHLN